MSEPIESMTIPPADLEFLRTREFNMEQLARACRMPPELLGPSPVRAAFPALHLGQKSAEYAAELLARGQRDE